MLQFAEMDSDSPKSNLKPSFPMAHTEPRYLVVYPLALAKQNHGI